MKALVADRRTATVPDAVCHVNSARHDGLRVRLVVLSHGGRSYQMAACSGCLQVASELGVVTMDRRR